MIFKRMSLFILMISLIGRSNASEMEKYRTMVGLGYSLLQDKIEVDRNTKEMYFLGNDEEKIKVGIDSLNEFFSKKPLSRGESLSRKEDIPRALRTVFNLDSDVLSSFDNLEKFVTDGDGKDYDCERDINECFWLFGVKSSCEWDSIKEDLDIVGKAGLEGLKQFIKIKNAIKKMDPKERNDVVHTLKSKMEENVIALEKAVAAKDEDEIFCAVQLPRSPLHVWHSLHNPEEAVSLKDENKIPSPTQLPPTPSSETWLRWLRRWLTFGYYR